MARFEVEPRMAGKKGRCKKCGQHMEIPRAEEIASMSAMPALVLAGAGRGGPCRARGREARRSGLAQGGGQPGRPGTAERVGRAAADPPETAVGPRRCRGLEALRAGQPVCESARPG